MNFGGSGADYTFEVIGSRVTLGPAFDAPCRGGTACTLGVEPFGEEVAVPPDARFLNRRLIRSSAEIGRPQFDFPWFIDMYMHGQLKLGDLQSRFRPMDEINEAFEDMLNGEVARAILTP
jgi:S-(hydroxymethyl)glutathione dehydrogenase / alcohol dehydrogenase